MLHQPTAEEVAQTIEIALDSLKKNSKHAEIAFFGGSFTAIDRGYMRSLLDATAPYIDRFKGIRISTRPDCIDEEILALLRSFHVTAIELGAQSMSNRVLELNERGHSAEDVRNASRLIRGFGFESGLQMMTGLYGSTADSDRETARAFVELHPDTVRIYPTIVMKNTRLGELYQAGLYQPQTLDEAVGLTAELIGMFESTDIRVIRVGLHDSETLRRDMPSAVRGDPIHEASAARDYDRPPARLHNDAIQVADDALDASLLHRRH